MDYARLVDIVRDEIRSDYVPNACILAARVTTIALRRFGIQSEPMAVELDAFSPAYMRLLEYASDLGREVTPEEVAKFAAQGAWRVSLNFGDAPEGVLDRRNGSGYYGHVVVLAENRRWMIDPTLPQVARPHKALDIEPPYAWEIDYDQALAGGGVVLSTDNGTYIIYKPLPDRRDFRRAPDWRLPGFREALFDETLRRVVDRLWKEEHAAHHR